MLTQEAKAKAKSEKAKVKSERTKVQRKISHSCDYSMIEPEIRMSDKGLSFSQSTEPNGDQFELWDPAYFVKSAIEAIVEDDVTKRFTSEELNVWNLLSRTHQYQHMNTKIKILWGIGVYIRYVVLLPSRLLMATCAVVTLAVNCTLIGNLPSARIRSILSRWSILNCFRLFIRAFSGVITFHNIENRPKSDGICVANHTTPIDVIILGCDNVYAMVGQKHDGFMGGMQRVFKRCISHVWFERGETRDRFAVAKRMREHVEDRDKLPLLVFPEGTCINNTSVMMFKKGSFEVGCTIYPVAIKYDPRFSDCFWNSSKYGLLRYMFLMMTSWAMKADVWYLPPERQHTDETAIQFANRVKRLIAIQGGLIDMQWDGALKRERPKENLKHLQQESYARFFKSNLLSERLVEDLPNGHLQRKTLT